MFRPSRLTHAEILTSAACWRPLRAHFHMLLWGFKGRSCSLQLFRLSVQVFVSFPRSGPTEAHIWKHLFLISSEDSTCWDPDFFQQASSSSSEDTCSCGRWCFSRADMWAPLDSPHPLQLFTVTIIDGHEQTGSCFRPSPAHFLSTLSCFMLSQL